MERGRGFGLLLSLEVTGPHGLGFSLERDVEREVSIGLWTAGVATHVLLSNGAHDLPRWILHEVLDVNRGFLQGVQGTRFS